MHVILVKYLSSFETKYPKYYLFSDIPLIKTLHRYVLILALIMYLTGVDNLTILVRFDLYQLIYIKYIPVNFIKIMIFVFLFFFSMRLCTATLAIEQCYLIKIFIFVIVN